MKPAPEQAALPLPGEWKLGYCAHDQCGGQRAVREYKGILACRKHWRNRETLAKTAKAVKEHKR